MRKFDFRDVTNNGGLNLMKRDLSADEQEFCWRYNGMLNTTRRKKLVQKKH